MVRRYRPWLILLLSLLPGSVAALSVEHGSGTLRYGQTFSLILHSARPQPDLRTIDLTPWREQVAIEQTTATTDATGQRLQLLLNPRRSGAVTLPPLWFAGERSEALALQIDAAADAGQPLTVTVSVSETDVWQRQQVLVRVRVRSPERYFQLQADPFRHPDLHVVPLPSETVEGEGSATTVRSTGWALYPSAAGTLELELPPIQYRRGGRRQARFALPPLSLQVRALPPYVPGDLPVGAVSIQSHLGRPGLHDTGALAFWLVEVNGRDVPAAWLPSPLGPVRDNRAVQFLTPEVQHRQRSTEAGLISTTRYRIPFSAQRSGALQLPELALQYFDPQSGRLVRVESAPVRVWALADVWRAALLVLLLLMGAWLGIRSLRRARVYRAWRRDRQEMLRSVAAARSAAEIRQALGQWGRRQGWPLNGSLGHWLESFDRYYRRVDPRLATVLSSLNRDEFSPHGDVQFEPLRDALLQALRKARRRRRSRVAQSAWLSSKSAMPPAAPR